MATASWQLRSTSGREIVSWEVRDDGPGRPGRVLRCDIDLRGQYYGATLGDQGSRPNDYGLSLRGLEVGVEDIERLCSVVETWVESSPSEQAGHRLELECNVGGLFDQSLILKLGRRDDRISGGRPVATLRYVVGSLVGEFVFVTDPRCLRLFAAGIRAATGSVSA